VATNSLGETVTRRNSESWWKYYRVRGMRAKLRVASNAGLIVGQCILLFASRDIGLAVIISSSLLSLPFFMKERMLDVTVLVLFMQVINIVGLIVK
jgi:hypothetical protein